MSSASRNVSAINARAAAEFQKNLEGLANSMEETQKRIVNQAVNIGFAHTVANTRIGVYPREINFVVNSGKDNEKKVSFKTVNLKLGGTLRRRWKMSRTRKDGNSFVGGYSNNTDYAIYVNNGHRIVSKGVTVGYWPGYHMLEIGMRMGERAMPLIFRDEIARLKRKTGF